MAVLGGLLAACGHPTPTVTASPSVPASTTTLAGHSYEGELTTTDGYRYKVTVALGARSSTGGPECAGTPAAGRSFLPVTLIVANLASDRAAPFPPLRVELTAGVGAKPVQVLVRDAAGNCTSTPRVASVAPGGSVVFNGTSPPIDDAAAPGSSGRIEVNVSESRFSLAAPLP